MKGATQALRGKMRHLAVAGLLLAVAPAALAQTAGREDRQGWSADEQAWWYDVSQGSRLLPLSWFQALEQAGSATPVLDDGNIRRHGYIPRRGPDGEALLPLGFAIDRQSDLALSVTRLRWRPGQGDGEAWVGFNCAACHTAEMRYRERLVRVDGGPASADFQSFFKALNEALRATAASPEKFGRFAARVLGRADGEQARQRLGDALKVVIAWQDKVERQNLTALEYGPARLDAVGHILNKVALVAGSKPLEPFPADAPVSYPFLWNAPQHDKVQWNGVARNDSFPITLFGQETDFGALGRNAGEVIGVFADVSVDSFAWNGFRSSVQARNLIELERLLRRLRSPVWPSALFGAPDQVKAARGRALYDEQKCASCHALLPAGDLTSPVKAVMTPLAEIGTDIWMACNTWDYRANTGRLEGVRENIYRGPALAGTDAGARMLTATVTGVLIGKADSILGSLAEDLFGRPSGRASPESGVDEARFTPAAGFPDDPVKRERAKRCVSGRDALLAYKARPLNGIWATAPYLHNGSVPTLYDLLLPPAMRPLIGPPAPRPADGRVRPEIFPVGTREFDPVRVGFSTRPDAPGQSFTFRTRDGALEILGNANTGHTYGTGLADEDRQALVEFLKTL